MSVQLLAGTEDLMRCRFAVSPLWETAAAVRTLADPRRGAYHQPWLRKTARQFDPAAIAPLLALLPRSGYTPDFLTPPPPGPLWDIDRELDRVAATPVSQVVTEVTRSLGSPPPGHAPVPAAIQARLLADPACTLRELVEILRACWELLVAPQWPRLRGLLDADIITRSRHLADGGLQRLLVGLHPAVRWADGAVHVDSPGRVTRHLNGSGLLLMPSAFIWPALTVLTEQPWQPTIIYPVHGIAGLWQAPARRAPQALRNLIGRTRAELLAGVAEPASTIALAQAHGLSPATVSGHLSALRDAGLLVSRRAGRTVLYERTPLGTALASGQPSPDAGESRLGKARKPTRRRESGQSRE